MSDLSPADRQLLVDALEAVVTTQPVTALRPGQVRVAVETRLGAETSYRLRREVHRVVVALEEGVPAGLVRRLPLTGTSLGRVARDLAESRGWTWDVASTAVELWAAALGSPLTAVLPDGTPDSSSRPRPSGGAPDVPLGVTMAPPGQPPAPSGSETPSSEAPSSPTPSSPAPDPVPTPAGATWPTPKSGVLKAAEQLDAPPALTGHHAAGGMSLVAVTLLLLGLIVVLCLPIFLLDVGGWLLSVLGFLLATPIAKRARFGLLSVHEDGVRFTPYKFRTRDPLVDQTVHAPWSAVTTQEGFVSRVRWQGTDVQVGPRGREVVRAIGRAAAGSTRAATR